jgi:quercetin dioxygenase-like cupin family protein
MTSAWGSFADLVVERPYEGIERRGFNAETATVTAYRFEPGARFPLHRHPQEQITVVEQGSVELRAGGELTTLRAGEWSVISPDVEHGISAGPDGARFIAIVVPRREGSAAYEVVEGVERR